MIDLKEEVIGSADKLQKIQMELAGGGRRSAIPSECYDRWRKLAGLHESLDSTAPLFEVRERAWIVFTSLVDPKRIAQEEQRAKAPDRRPDRPAYNFSYDGVEMDFSSARHLALVSYMSVSWSIYDRLSNVCGRLAATSMVEQHTKQNPKLVEDLLGGEKKKENEADQSKPAVKTQSQADRDIYGAQLFAFSMQFHLKQAYEWPARLSYGIRNWVVHEGESMGSRPLFHSDHIEDGFRLHEDAVLHLQDTCNFRDDNGKPKRCCLRDADSPWKEGQPKNLQLILKAYHAEIDTMFHGLLKWTVGAFVGQITAFAARSHDN